MLTRQEVAELLGVPVQTLGEWAYRNKGPAYHRVGRHVRYSEADVAAWLETQRKEPAR